ncbi:hypothetical protein DFA_06475 [Cavenderia fasciculata]|uniref:Uncharacterized protein n=1 Tax=Cavenderia fasciculata TaxID=261658 RepID=F4PJ39_CACFS|nr:uncharacterized protein DFA_06475 [Cavenderia fasciculata]EGG24325.1 hypothetical protein DFA_06475 [Cavenderia fasciculata]|eukprot:XP_004362176.1 hypothetical protein DFA_06475 [Cavenderia fasciculata]
MKLQSRTVTLSLLVIGFFFFFCSPISRGGVDASTLNHITLGLEDNLKHIQVNRGDIIQVRLDQINGRVKYSAPESDGLTVLSSQSQSDFVETVFRADHGPRSYYIDSIGTCAPPRLCIFEYSVTVNVN